MVLRGVKEGCQCPDPECEIVEVVRTWDITGEFPVDVTRFFGKWDKCDFPEYEYQRDPDSSGDEDHEYGQDICKKCGHTGDEHFYDSD
jgi:hypothetical protein